jgi:GTPase SAR1 family protein
MAGQTGNRSSSAPRGTERSRRARGGGMIEAKIILLGDSAVGKSSIALRFCQDRFDEVHDVTIGGAYLQKIISIQNPENPTGPE